MKDSRAKQKNTGILTFQSGRYPTRIIANEPVHQKRSASVAKAWFSLATQAQAQAQAQA